MKKILQECSREKSGHKNKCRVTMKKNRGKREEKNRGKREEKNRGKREETY